MEVFLSCVCWGRQWGVTSSIHVRAMGVNSPVNTEQHLVRNRSPAHHRKTKRTPCGPAQRWRQYVDCGILVCIGSRLRTKRSKTDHVFHTAVGIAIWHSRCSVHGFRGLVDVAVPSVPPDDCVSTNVLCFAIQISGLIFVCWPPCYSLPSSCHVATISNRISAFHSLRRSRRDS